MSTTVSQYGYTSLCTIAFASVVHTGVQAHISPCHRRSFWTCKKGKGRSSADSKSVGRSRAAKRAVFYQAMQLYRDHFQPLLDAELRAEQQALLQQQNFERQVKSGGKLHLLKSVIAVGKSRLFSMNVYTLRPKSRKDKLPDSSQFRRGDLVQLSCANESDGSSIEGAVLKKTPFEMFVTIPIGSNGSIEMDSYMERGVSLYVRCGANTLAYERASCALSEFTNVGPSATNISKLLTLSFAKYAFNPRMRSSGNGYDDVNTSISMVSDAKSKSSTGGEWEYLASETVSKLSQGAVASCIKELPSYLNPSQKHAIRTSLRQRLTLIQGPPGAGKTVTAAHMIACAVKLRLGPVLACAASNVAADNLLSNIIAAAHSSCRVIRFGRIAAVNEELWKFSLESLLEKDAEVRKARELCASGKLRFDELQKIEIKATRTVLHRADVVVSTCVLSGREELKKSSFSFVVVDEATQATEPDVLIPLSIAANAGNECQLILVGDQNQLPPTVLSGSKGEVVDMGLETSLFERLWMCGVECQLLNVQYRMHPEISRFPSSHFYSKRLKDGVTAKDRPLPSDIQEDVMFSRSRVVFVNVYSGYEESDENTSDGISSSFSYSNRAEADAVMKYLRQLLGVDGMGDVNSFGFKVDDVGVISAYASQVKLLKELLQDQELSSVEVNTVDGFQGREKEAIIISCVRSNKDRKVGFLRDWRRLNVAITRARLGVIVVGNEHTLRADHNWKLWIDWVGRNGQCVDYAPAGH